jgi:hypothetical protein
VLSILEGRYTSTAVCKVKFCFPTYLLGLLSEAEYATGSEAAALAALDEGESVATAIGAHMHRPGLLLSRGRQLRGNQARTAFRAAREEALRQGATALAITATEELTRLSSTKIPPTISNTANAADIVAAMRALVSFAVSTPLIGPGLWR